MRNIVVKDFIWGIINTLESRSLPRGGCSDALNWIHETDKIELRRGYAVLGDEGSTGKVPSVYVAKMADGTEVAFRTRGKKLEYLNTTTDTWTEIGTDVLGSDADGKDISFAEYHSLAGDQLFVSSPYGPLLKIMLANPGDYADMYDSSLNYKGYIKIKQNRMFLWGRLKDKTGVYISWIDEMNSTAVSDENIGTGDGSEKTFADTLAFKAAGAKRTCFGIEATDGTETFTDNNDGTLTGDKGGTGTINYMTGAISITFNSAPAGAQAITCDYSWEDSTNNGICDFGYSATRIAGEGDSFRQDDGGILQSIESYGAEEYCLHRKKGWVLTMTADDTNATNVIYREKLGIPNWRASVATDEGIYYIDDSEEKDPQMKTIMLQVISGQILPVKVSKGKKYKTKLVGIDLSGYEFNKSVGIKWGDYILFTCRTTDVAENNRLIVYDRIKKSIDILDYWCSDLAIYNGTLIAGDPFTDNVYTLFSGFDDDEALILNHWDANEDDLDLRGMKKVKKLVVIGNIGPDQVIMVQASIDNGPFVDIGSIEGSGDYVDQGQEISVGRMTIGSKEIGGGGSGVSAWRYETEITLALDKFETIKLRFEAIGLGYASISEWRYYDIRWKNQKIPSKYRS